jgi:hypothetical protein
MKQRRQVATRMSISQHEWTEGDPEMIVNCHIEALRPGHSILDIERYVRHLILKE